MAVSLRKWVVVFSMLILCTSAQSATYGGGSGTIEDPYQIWTAEHMNTIGANSTDWSKHFKIMADIDMSAYTGTLYKIIGNSSTNFTGSFDGNGFIIQNLTINRSTTSNIGLFGCVGVDGQIFDLGVENANISGSWCVGGIVGHNYGSITSCYSAVTISGYSSVGGLVGDNSGLIMACYSMGTVSGGYDGYGVGGLVGSNGGSSAKIEFSYSISQVIGQYSSNAGKYVGGLLGLNNNSSLRIISCFWDTETSGKTTSSGGTGLTTEQMKTMEAYQNADWSGHGWVVDDGQDYPRFEWEDTNGIPIPVAVIPYVGSGTPEDPYQIWTTEDFQNLNTFSSILDKHIILMSDLDFNGISLNPLGSSVKKFTGNFDGQGFAVRNVVINLPNSDYVGIFGYVKNGTIKNLGVEDVNIVGKYDVGGLIGRNHFGIVSNCYVTGSVSGYRWIGGLIGGNDGSVNDSYSSASVNGNDTVGGLVGYNNGEAIEGCFASGCVTGKNDIGGLIGCNTLGSVSNSYSICSVNGSDELGGLIGDNSSGIVSNCYATGLITDSDSSSYSGGLIGYNYDGEVFGSFWDTETSGKTTSDGGRGLTTEGMKTELFYLNSGWADNGWVINEGLDYPRMEWEGTVGVLITASSLPPIPFLGSGTVEDPYQIWTAEDFVELNSYFSVLDKNIILMSDLDLSGVLIYPIGESGPFTGNFNGNNHVIRNANISQSNHYYTGIFGYLGENGVIINLGIENVNIVGKDYTGGLVGINAGGTIDNCSVTGVVAGSSLSIGGLAGYNDGTIANCNSMVSVSGIGINKSYIGGLVGYNNGVISRSYSTGSVLGNVYSSSTMYIGGLVGYNFDGSINSCFSASLVSSFHFQSYLYNTMEFLGGLVGNNQGSLALITNSYSIGSVSGLNDTIFMIGGGRSFVGGFVGSNGERGQSGGTIRYCYSTGLTSGRTVGCFAGVNYSGTIASCFWNKSVGNNRGVGYGSSSGVLGKTTIEMQAITTFTDAGWDFADENINGTEDIWQITADSYPNLAIYDWTLAGDGTLSNPYIITNATDLIYVRLRPSANYSLNNDIDLSGLSWTVPLISVFCGVFDGHGFVISNATIENQNSNYAGIFGILGLGGQIKNLGVENVQITGFEYVGGLVGVSMGRITNCYSTGSLTATGHSFSVGGLVGINNIPGGIIDNCYSEASVYSAGNCSAGGLSGRNYGDITHSYSIGQLSGTGSLGGLVGFSSGTISACLWDVDKSGLTWSSGGKGLTTEQMKTMVFYQNAGWANNGWVMNDGIDYPRFMWENTTGVSIPEDVNIPLAGSGSQEDPYQIWTVEDFVALNSYFSVLDKNIILMSDLDFQGVIIYSIGELGPFTGNFNGNNHVIRNVNITQPNNNYVGIFGRVDKNGQILNLDVEDVNIIGKTYTGGLVGYNRGSIISCHLSGFVSGTSNSTGGLVGSSSSSITNCYTTVSVNGTVSVGGLVGDNSGSSAKISNCYSTGSVKGTGSNVGGLVGNSYGNIIYSYSTCSVSGNADVGGLVGSSSSSIDNCYSTGSVNGTNYVGGLVGYNSGSSAKISFCYSKSTATAYLISSYASVSSGGLIGYNSSGTISDSYSAGSVSSTANSTSSPAYAYSGGLIGYSSSGNAMNCYATSSVLAVATSTSSTSTSYSGGLIGNRQSGTVTSCLWDRDTSGKSNAVGSGSSDGIAGKTTMEIQMLSTFTNAGWDFAGELVNGNSDIWRMCVDGVGYPRLNWEFLQYGDFVCPNGVMFSDFAVFAENWLMVYGDLNFDETFDFDKNEAVDVNDLMVLCDGWLTEFDFVDFAGIAASWDTIKGNPEFNHILDLDNSGTIDSGDLVIFCENWLSEI